MLMIFRVFGCCVLFRFDEEPFATFFWEKSRVLICADARAGDGNRRNLFEKAESKKRAWKCAGGTWMRVGHVRFCDGHSGGKMQCLQLSFGMTLHILKASYPERWCIIRVLVK